MNRESHVLHLLGVSSQQATHIRLIRGVVAVNPHLQVLCPTLVRGDKCHRGGKQPKDWIRPKLLVKNHGDSGLQLWSCEGCTNFLLRVNMRAQKLIHRLNQL